MRIGDEVTRQPVTLRGEFESDESQRSLVRKILTGRVVYIHPERRYYTVEFRLFGWTFRESFYFYPRSAGE